jgi:hypothetical protein
LEHLSDASFLGKLLVLPTNVRLDWKVIASYKHSSLFGLIVSDEGKKFHNIDTWTPVLCQYSKAGSKRKTIYFFINRTAELTDFELRFKLKIQPIVTFEKV